MSSPDRLPPALPAMWRALRRGYDAEPTLLLMAFGLSLLAALPDALLALWLKLLADGVLGGDRTLVTAAALGLGVSATATWFLRVVADRTQRRFRDRVTIALESHVAKLQASIPTIAHQERPEYLDRLSVLRDQMFVLDHMYMSLFGTAGWVLRLGITVVLLMSIHPALALLAVFALPTVITSTWRPGPERAAQERAAPANRLARHLFDIATTAPPGKEVRLAGIGDRLIRQRREAWDRGHGPVAAARWVSAAWHSVAWAIFGAAFVGMVVFVARGLAASPGDVLLVLAAGSRLSAYIAATVGEIGFLRGIWMDGSRRLAWLEDYAASLQVNEDATVPRRLAEGIRLEHVSFAYPGTDRLVLDDVSLDLDAGAVVAIVGENGAGKSTLVKLLCRLYQPTSGRILVDGIDLGRMPAEAWRARLAGAFQDFFRFELPARHTIGVGDVPRIDDTPAVNTAVERAGAGDVVGHLAAGLDTQLGASWPEGIEVSFGQWQKLALARGFMRDRPLLLLLDEPTAALDAETEHALFERYAAASRRAVPEIRVSSAEGTAATTEGVAATTEGVAAVTEGEAAAAEGVAAGAEGEAAAGEGAAFAAEGVAAAAEGAAAVTEGVAAGAEGEAAAAEGAAFAAEGVAAVTEGEAAAAEARERRTDNPNRHATPSDGRITILVSHRFSTVRMADLIVVLDGARLVEVGSHEELVARSGHYAELYRIQAAAYARKETDLRWDDSS